MKTFLLVVSILCFNSSALAYTECKVKLSRIYVGDESEIVWFAFAKGGSASKASGEKNFNNILSVSLAAKMADKDLIIRFKEDGVPCNSGHRRDIRGLWLL